MGVDWQIKFNVAKRHSMRVTRHSPLKQIKHSYSLHNQTLEQVTSAQYLGITITDKLDWGQDVSEVSTKATQTLGFLRRNLALATRETKDMAYKTLVLQFGIPTSIQRLTSWRRCRGLQPAEPVDVGASRPP